MDAILGYTGLVGSTIREGLDPKTTEYYNTKNFHSVEGKAFRNVYCACIPAVKWWANKNPESDWKNIHDIISILKTVTCEKFILISTIDVHDTSHQMQTECVEYPAKHAYGHNRLVAEKNLFDIFQHSLYVIRLPALFGIGLKKNIIYDLINDNRVEHINGNTSYQWYPLKWLLNDIRRFMDMEPELLEKMGKTINLYPDPIETMDIVRRFFPEKSSRVSFGKRFQYNQSTKARGVLNYQGSSQRRYIMNLIGEFAELTRYISLPVNRMVVSNMAWDPVHDSHALFILKRYGITKVEIMPTKYGKWEDIFSNPSIVTKKYIEGGIQIYSFQSVLFGVDGDFIHDSNDMRTHLDEVAKLCKKVGGQVIVMGSPSKRIKPISCPKNTAEKYVTDVLFDVQEINPSVKICLEPNSTSYGCSIGTDITSCTRMAKHGFYVNFDTGNFSMESDNAVHFDEDIVGHCQLSSSFLRPIHITEYMSMLDPQESDIFHCLRLISTSKNEQMISLESKVERIQDLGENIHNFASFVSKLMRK